MKIKKLKKKYFNLFIILKKINKKVKILNEFYLKKLKKFLKIKFKKKKYRRIRFLKKLKIIIKKKKTKKELFLEKKNDYIKKILHNLNKFKVKHHSMKYKFKKITKKKFLFKRRQKLRPFILNKRALNLVYFELKIKKGEKVFTKLIPRYKFPGSYKEKKQIS
jgi:hypothetical protein